ncbi:MAG: porin family protein [Psychroflexus sp.]
MKVIFTIFIALLASMPMSAQDTNFGVKGGLNFSNFFADEPDDTNIKTGLNFSLYSRKALVDELLFLQAELGYSGKGSKVEGDFGEMELGLAYLELPLMASVGIGNTIFVEGGAYAAYLLDANISGEDNLGNSFSDEIDRDNFKDFDYGLAVGANVNLSSLVVGARYYYGMQDIVDSDLVSSALGDVRNSNIQVYVAFEF